MVPKSAGKGLALVALCIAFGASALGQQQGGAEPPPPGVVVEEVGTREVADRETFTGHIEAVDEVDLRARVEGYLQPLHFEQGSVVEKDALLFTIEKDAFEAAVDEARADVARAEAAVDLARVTRDRTQKLAANNNIAQAQLDEAEATLAQAQADVAAAKAQLRRAELDLGYTDITAPMKGRIGKAAYSPGALVGPSSEPLATLVSQDPMEVVFPVPQRILLEVQRADMVASAVNVRLQLADGSIYEETGSIDYAEVQANPSTDSVTVRATIANPDGLLVDEQLVSVLVEQKEPETRIAISQSAMLLDQRGAYVLVVDDEDKIEQRRIEIGEQRGSFVVVTAGLEEGERVVVSGMQKVRPGQKVAPETAGESVVG